MSQLRVKSAEILFLCKHLGSHRSTKFLGLISAQSTEPFKPRLTAQYLSSSCLLSMSGFLSKCKTCIRTSPDEGSSDLFIVTHTYAEIKNLIQFAGRSSSCQLFELRFSQTVRVT